MAMDSTRRENGSIRPGMPVEVRNQLSMSWSHGFEVATVDGEGCRLRRLSDGRVLPAVFDVHAVRPAALN
jgi:hypothetical protein